jgi:hypothetical protein
MSTVLEPAGEVALSEVAEVKVKLVAATVPKLTELAPVKPEPVTVTVVPPARGPAGGLTALTAGATS